MKILMSHPTGNANVRAAAGGFSKADILAEFNTTIATFPGSILNKLSGFGPLSELRRRSFDPVLEHVTKIFPWREVGRIAASKAGIQRLTKHEAGIFSIDAVYQSMDRRVMKRILQANKRCITAVYAYEDGALQSFIKAKEIGLQCFYDLPIGYWRTARRLLDQEREFWPDWATTLTGFQDSEAKLARKDEELNLADRVFVASRFTAETLKEFPGTLGPVEVIPYGFPPVCAKRDYSAFLGNRPLKILFVGGLSQRKGIANLFKAVESIGSRVELTIVGRKVTNDCKVLNAALARHCWIPSMPHKDVLKLMQAHDVLVFPSLFEGFGLVITEAMSQGTPVITTERTAGPDLIQHGQNGWLIEAGSTESLKASIEELLYNPSVLAKVGREAMETALNRPWKVYGRELAESIIKHRL